MRGLLVSYKRPAQQGTAMLTEEGVDSEGALSLCWKDKGRPESRVLSLVGALHELGIASLYSRFLSPPKYIYIYIYIYIIYAHTHTHFFSFSGFWVRMILPLSRKSIGFFQGSRSSLVKEPETRS